MFKKVFISFGLLLAFISIFSFQSNLANASVNDEEIIPMPGMDVLVEEDIKTSKEQREKVMQDMKEHPELVQFAIPVTNEY
ncbi:hypothetical protein [Bacillus bombysepticus]|uniref:hypothetical protein n=1 Tax=Bacillus bombysepticus TaxID=658666 RepID=UPI00207AD42D|nr:hypothetical protein [Bacillus bombysepticus]USL11101.1 hypothetical protein LIT24_29320 [Bacillus bombysepticus]